MMAFITSVNVWVGIILLAVFWLTAHWMPTQTTLLVSNSFMLSFSTAVWIAYLPACLKAIATKQPKRVKAILLGIFYSWFFGSIWRIHSLIWLKAGSPDWFVQNDLLAFYQSGITFAAAYHLASPGAIGGALGQRVPALKWIVLGGVAGVAVLLSMALAAFDVDTSRFVNQLRPYIPGAPPV